jgi:hypothetical protein
MKAFASLLLASILGAVFALTAEHGISSGFINEAKAADSKCEGATLYDNKVDRGFNQRVVDTASSLVSNGYRIVGFTVNPNLDSYTILGCK